MDATIVRWATLDDVGELVRLRRQMFDEMGWDLSDDTWEPAAHDVIAAELAADRLVAAVVDAPGAPGMLAASGIVQFWARLPAPGIVGGLQGYVLSMSTDPTWRRRGLAREVFTMLMDECRRRDVASVSLHATESGRPLYEAFGFRLAQGGPELRWFAT